MRIRKATKKDIGGIANIMMETFSKPPWNEKWNKKNALKVINNYYKIAEIYALLIEKEIIGFIIIREEPSNLGPWINIEELAVKQKFQKKGVSKELIKFTRSLSKKRGAKIIYFSTHKKYIKFYEKFGYKYDKNKVYMSKKLK